MVIHVSADQAEMLADAVREEIYRLRLLIMRNDDWPAVRSLCEKAGEAIEGWERVLEELEEV